MKDRSAIAGPVVAAHIVGRRADKSDTAMHYAALARQVADENESVGLGSCLSDGDVDIDIDLREPRAGAAEPCEPSDWGTST